MKIIAALALVVAVSGCAVIDQNRIPTRPTYGTSYYPPGWFYRTPLGPIRHHGTYSRSR